MPISDNSKSDLIRDFEEFQRKFEAAARLTRSDFKKEAKRIHDIAFFPYAAKGGAHGAPANGSENALWIKDVDDPERWKSIEGRDQRQRIDGALWYYLEALLPRMRSHIREHFKPVAAIARISPSSKLLSSNLLFEDVLHGAPHYITDCQSEGRNWVDALCDFWGRPNWVTAFNDRFHRLFAEEWERLVCEAELETSPQLSRAMQPKRAPIENVHSRSPRRVESSGPHSTERDPEGGPRPHRSSFQEQSPRTPDQRKQLIAEIKSTGERKVENIVSLVDKAIVRMTKVRQESYAPLKEWRNKAPGARTWEEFLAHPNTHGKVRNYINKIPALPSSISKKSN